MLRLFLFASLLIACSSPAATISWKASNSGAWNTASNWDPAQVPGNADTAVIGLPGTYSVYLSNDVTVAALNVGADSGAPTLDKRAFDLTITGSGTVGANGVLTTTGGLLAGRLTIAPSGALRFEGPAAKSLYNLTLVNQGTVEWLDGQLNGGSTPGTVITNFGFWKVSGNNSLAYAIGGTVRFENFGTFHKLPPSTGVTTIGFAFANHGTVEALSGTLSFSTSFTNFVGGTFFAETNAIIQLVSGDFLEGGGQFIGPGILRQAGGTITLLTNALSGLNLTGGSIRTGPNFQNNGAITNLTLNGSTLEGTARVSGQLIATNGSALTGKLTVEPSGTLTFSGSPAKTLYSLTLVNQGTVNWLGGQLNGGSTPGTVITNFGLWIAQGNDNFAYAVGGTVRFENFGTFRKQLPGTGVTTIQGFAFANYGTVEALSGTLSFSTSFTNFVGGTFYAETNAVIQLVSGDFIEGGGQFTGPGILRQTGGTITLLTNSLVGLNLTAGSIRTGPNFQNNGAITNLTLNGSTLEGTARVSGQLIATNGSALTGRLTIESSGMLTFSGSPAKTLYSLTLVNEGTVNWLDGQLNGGSTPGTVITNFGLWIAAGDDSFAYAIGGTVRFENFGTFRKQPPGTGTTTIQGFAFANYGTVEALSGTLSFSTSFTNFVGGTFFAETNAIIQLVSGEFIEGGAQFTGGGTGQQTGGTLTLQTNSIPGLNLVAGFVRTGPNFQQGGAITNLVINGGNLSGNNRVAGNLVVTNGGDLSGLLIIEPSGTLTFSGSATKELYSLTLINEGTVNWLDGQLNGGSTPGTIITNRGLWIAAGNNATAYAIGGIVRFENIGTFRKFPGTNTTTIQGFAFNNYGLVETLSGVLTFSTSFTNLISGTFITSAGAATRLMSGDFLEGGSVFSGAGSSQMINGDLTLRTNIIPGLNLIGGNVRTGPAFQQAGAITNLTLSGSTLVGISQVAGNLVASNASGISGRLTIDPSGTLTFTGSAAKSIYSLTLINHGLVNWLDGQLNSGSTPGTIISNFGRWLAQGNDNLAYAIGGTVRFENFGTFQKISGIGQTAMQSFDLNNAGVIEVLSGTLQLPSPFTNRLGTLRVAGTTLDSAGPFSMDSGILEGSGSVDVRPIRGGLISPGTNDSGILTFPPGLQLEPNATVAFDIFGATPGSQHDQLNVVGQVNLGGATLQFPQIAQLFPGQKIILIANDGSDAVVGQFNGHPEGSLFTAHNQLFRIRYSEGTGNDVALVRDDGGVRLNSIKRSTNSFQPLRGLGTNFMTYSIEATTNFFDWTPIGTATADSGGLFFFNDTNAHQFRYRFYRSIGP